MSTDHMPSPPDQPTGKTTDPSAPGMTSGTAVAGDSAAAQGSPSAPGVPLGEEMANILTEQVPIIVQKHIYHAQLFYGVSGIGADPVNARNATLAVANALRTGDHSIIAYALVNLGDPQISQVNDHTVPFRFNVQVAGLLEGILLDTLDKAYKNDKGRSREARQTLEQIFIEANEEAGKQSKAMLAFNAPGPHPNARK